MNDGELLARLARAFERFDPVPVGIGRAAVRAGGLASRVVDALALVVDGAPGGVRGGGRVLGFAGTAGRVDVEVAGDGERVELAGVASVRESLWVRWPDGERLVDVDDWGRFVVAGLSAGPLSFRVGESVGAWFVG